MTAPLLIREICRRAHWEPVEESPENPDGDEADCLIGLFQKFRPDGRALEGFFSDLEPFSSDETGDGLDHRLSRLFEAAGDDRRPQGGRDAYFVVRRPEPIEPVRAEALARDWFQNLHDLAISVGDAYTAERFEAPPRFRVLEGLPPKHPRSDEEKVPLLLAMQRDVPELLLRSEGGPGAAALRKAYYFVACDPMLRDYLMWPLYRRSTGLTDPYAPYFELWRHGVKYRCFQQGQMDLYLPRL